jgi:8-oxo-dGTP pyrophosphatase MutT (NUDIX family)
MVPQPIARLAARVLLIDEAERVLLFHGIDPADPSDEYWITPGGGLEPGESPAQGAVRELFEETGLRVDRTELGEPVYRNVVEFSFDGRRYRQEQDFFLLRVPSWEVDTTNFDDVERVAVDGYRWWFVDELESSAERFYPELLPTLLRRLVEV